MKARFRLFQGRAIMAIKLNCYSVLLLTVLTTLAGCQTTAPLLSQDIIQDENTMTMKAEDTDSDGDGVLDAIDECPETPLHIVVDAKGCPVIIEGDEALEMAFSGFFPKMSRQLPTIYDSEFSKIAEKLREYPKANIFVFGHVAPNEPHKDSLSRNRALIIKNMLVLNYDIAAERISTYDCLNKILDIDTGSIDSNFKALTLKDIESKQSRATLMASSEVDDLMNLEYISYTKKYGEYAKHCEQFE